jgi:hypothetical protein
MKKKTSTVKRAATIKKRCLVKLSEFETILKAKRACLTLRELELLASRHVLKSRNDGRASDGDLEKRFQEHFAGRGCKSCNEIYDAFKAIFKAEGSAKRRVLKRSLQRT